MDGTIVFNDLNSVSFETDNSGSIETEEIGLNEFICTLDNNIESDKYNVYYNDEEGFRINYNDGVYDVILSKNMERDKEENQVFKHLLMLSKVEEHIGINSENKIDDGMDDETRQFYLSILKNERKSVMVKRYFSNLGSDIKHVFKWTISNIGELFIKGFMMGLLFSSFPLIPAVTASGINFLQDLLIVVGCGFSIGTLRVVAEVVIYQTAARIVRLKEYREYKKIRELRSKILKGELVESKNLCIEQKEDIVEMKIEKTIPVYINNLIESLKEVPISKRRLIIHEIEELTQIYAEKIDDSSKKDSEIAAENPEILTMINQIEMRIHKAKKIDIQREKEVEYLLEKLANVEVEEEQVETKSDEIQKGLHI